MWKGVAVLCKLSKDNASGYLNVNKLRNSQKGPVWQAKFVPAGEQQQRGLPGSCSLLAWEAAAALAYHEAGHGGLLPEKKIYAQRRSTEVRARPPAHAHASAHECRFAVCRRKTRWMSRLSSRSTGARARSGKKFSTRTRVLPARRCASAYPPTNIANTHPPTHHSSTYHLLTLHTPV